MTKNSLSAKEVHVQVFLHPGGSNGDFHFETIDLPMGPDNHLYFSNCGHSGFLIHYDIQGTDDYVFPDSEMTNHYLDEALFCHAQTACPTTKSTWGQFTAQNVQSNGKTLVVDNKNQSRADFGYALRVTKDKGANYLLLDPVGTNWNGTAALSSSSMTLAAIGGAAVGVLLTLGAQALLGS